MDNDQRKKNSI